MYCPNDECPDFLDTGLRAEYRDDIERCPYCRTALVAEAPSVAVAADGNPEKPRVGDDEPMEPVIEATDLSEVAVIKSILDGAAIPFLTTGEDQFTAFRGAFAGGSIFNPRARGVVFSVPSRMADEARTLLEEIADAAGDT
jgi:hypothetical protein